MSAALAATLTLRATRLDVALVTPEGLLGPRRHLVSRAPLTPADVAEALTLAVAPLLAEARSDGLAAVGLALEGAAVVLTRGVVVALPGLPGWAATPLAATLAERLALPVAVDSLAGAALRAEVHEGALRGAEHAALVETSRAVTAALWLGGARAGGPFAGEIGHLPVVAGGLRCGCGSYGHLDTIVPAQALARALIGALVDAPATEAAVARLTEGRAEAITAPQIWQLVCDGDPVATRIMDLSLDALAFGLVTLALTVDCDRIAIGGALAGLGDDWLAKLAEHVARLAPPPRAAEIAGRLHLGALGPGAAMRGAALLAVEAWRNGDTTGARA